MAPPSATLNTGRTRQGTPDNDRDGTHGGMHHTQPTRQQPRRAPFTGRAGPSTDRGDSIADSDMRDLILVHVNVHPPSPPGTLDVPAQERSLTPITEVDSDIDIPRSASPDRCSNVKVDSVGTVASGTAGASPETSRAGDPTHADPLSDNEFGTESSTVASRGERLGLFLLPRTPPREPETGQYGRAGQGAVSFPVPTISCPASSTRHTEFGTTVPHSAHSHPYLPPRRPPSRESSSGSSIIITHTVVSDGHQPTRTYTYPLVAHGSSQAIAAPMHHTQTNAPATIRAVRGPQSQIMIHPNYSHTTFYPDIIAAAGLGFGTPFQTPRQHAMSLPPPPPDFVQPSSTYPGGTESELLDLPPTAGHTSTGEPEQRHTRTSSNWSSVTPVNEHETPPWCPKWDTFSLTVWRAKTHETIEVRPEWDDEDLLRELRKTYNILRSWRRVLSLKGPRYLTRVAGDESLVYPQRIGPGRITSHRALRIRFLLKHPEHARGKRDLMYALTQHPDVGVEFVEQWQVWRVACLVLGMAVLSMAIAIATSILLHDWSTGFSIGSFFAQMFAVILVAIGFVHYEEL